MIRIQVPATSANLGPGFDCMGMALSLYNSYTFERIEKLEIQGCPQEYANADNLIYKAYAKVFEVCGKEPWGVRIHIESAIPISRGLGSSATCVVAGVLAANYFLNNPLDDHAVLNLCTELEGHPDNVAPALFGGVQACFREGDIIYHNRYALHSSYHLTVLIPPTPLSTQEARAVLPQMVSRKDVVFTLSHALATLRYLENGDYEHLKLAMQDCLHQPYRLPLIAYSEEVMNWCREAGGEVVYLSGAGPTLLCISEEIILPKLERVKQLGWTVQEVQLVEAGAIREEI